MSETPLNQDQNSDEIDLKDLIIPIWKSRKQILFTALIFAVVGGIIGFLTPATYTAGSTFLPQTTQSGGGGSSLGGLAALAGISLNAPITGGDIPPSMYATVLASEPFRKRILDSKIWLDGDSVTYRTYLEGQPASTIVTIQEYTIGLPRKLFGLLSSSEVAKEVEAESDLKPLSDSEYALHNALAGKITIVNDKKEGVVSLMVVEGDPLIAAQVAKVTEQVLQDWISEHKVKNAKAQYDFVAKQFEAKQKEFFSIQDQLAGYMDRNQNVLSATYLTRLERLQAEFDLVNTIYSELAKQKEQAAIQLSKDTPTFSILNPVKVPKEKTDPRKSNYVFVAFFIGLILSVFWFSVRKPLLEFFVGLQSKA
jgi:uncharacterized protein involved in exopolysaccharide biosynthesis